MQRKLFSTIFSDAHVVDFDWSRWDQLVALYVLADHVERVEGGRKALYAVEFVRVSRLNVTFNHLDVPPLGPDEHMQWMIDDQRIEEDADGLVITLWGLRASPLLEIACKDVRIKPVDLKIFDELFPGWDQPSLGLARPTAEVMHQVMGLAAPVQPKRRPTRR